MLSTASFLLSPTVLRVVTGSLLGVLLILTPWWYWRVQRQEQRNFRVVRQGVLYRSGQMTPEGLTRAIREHGLRTIISLRSGKTLTEEPPDREEEELCASLGLRHFRLPAKAWDNPQGGTDGNAQRFCAIVSDPRYQPVLVHCFAGKHRTGAYCAVYRMECEGWSSADAVAEMTICGYETIDENLDVRDYLMNYRPSGRCQLQSLVPSGH